MASRVSTLAKKRTTATKKRLTNGKAKVDKTPVKKKESEIKLKPMTVGTIEFTIAGDTPLICHQFSEKAKEMMRQKAEGRKTKDREPRDPEREGEEATYYTSDGRDGIPGLAIKAAMIEAAHKDLGIEKVLVRKAIHIIIEDDKTGVIPIDYDSKEVKEDTVIIGRGTADLRYRPYYYGWSVRVKFRVDWDLLQQSDIVALVDRAGFGVGLCEWRPQKGGQHGTFKVDNSEPIDVQGLE